MAWQAEPKSMIFRELELISFNNMFSGFKSRWIIFNSGFFRKDRALAICSPIFLIKDNWFM